MRGIASVLLVVSLSACGAVNRTLRSDLEHCGLRDGHCNPEQIAAVSEGALRRLGGLLKIDCGTFASTKPESQAHCRERVVRLIGGLSRKFPGVLTLDVSEVAYDESETCLDTFIPGREGADCAFVQIRAAVPLHWLAGQAPN